METQKILKAGKIAKQVKGYAKNFIKPGMKLLDIAEKIEEKIIELGGKPAFPVNLGIDEVAAHYTPSHNDETLARGLLKVDFGVHIDGWIADVALSLDLDNSAENRELIRVSEEALKKAIETAKENILVSSIGKTIQKTIESHNLSPIISLCGHQMEQYDLHTGTTIPNIYDERPEKLSQGLYAIEPFVTRGSGKTYEGRPSEIYSLIDERSPRTPMARKVLSFVMEEYKTLPFCTRWIVKKFGSVSLFAIKELERNSNIQNFPQLIESSKAKVSQTEDTILVEKGKIIVTSD